MSSKQKKIDFNKKNVVLLAIGQRYKFPYLIEQARKRDLRFFDIMCSNGYLSDGFKAIGVITDLIPDNPFCRTLRKFGCPIVRMGKLPHPQDDIQPAVLPDLLSSGILGTKHFASRGFKNVGFIGHTPWGDGRGIYEGILKESKDLGIELHLLRKKPIPIPPELKGKDRGDYIRRFRHNEIKKWLKTLPKPIGIIGYNHSICSDIDLLCNSLEIAVPGEVSILCYNDVPECKITNTELSAIDIGIKNIAAEAIELLNALIEGKNQSEDRIFVPPSHIVLRHSTDILAVPDPAVAKALSFIWENFSKPISVDDIASASGVSVRTLTSSFKKCLNRTMTQELLRKRLEKACELLRKDSMIVEDIAKTVGFDSKAYFYKKFKESYGVTPYSFKNKKM